MEALEAGFWGFVGSASLLVGAFVGLYAGVAQRVIAIVMAAGAGVLVSSVAFELMMGLRDGRLLRGLWRHPAGRYGLLRRGLWAVCYAGGARTASAREASRRVGPPRRSP
jgi:hypothetical protein